ncbi:MAG TPA: four-helix bundle copper-binding protein [Burkholderiales bacterium]|nr:four-helix bundle copper-binding protein [Burkholderiales bacterium]
MNQQVSKNQEMQQCIEDCQHCHNICLQTAMTNCLKMGGKHVEPEHFRLMTSCAEICQSANFMLSNSALHANVCQACADVCEACAVSCEKIGGMDECFQACRRCAQSCRQMASADATQTMSSQIRQPTGASGAAR